MRTFVAGLVVPGAFVLVSIIGAVVFLAGGKLARYSVNESHFADFMLAVTSVAVAVGSAFPIFGRGVPWLAAWLERAWPALPEQPSSSYSDEI